MRLSKQQTQNTSNRNQFLKPSFHLLLDLFPNIAKFHIEEGCVSASNQVSKQQHRLCRAQSQRGSAGCRVRCWKIQSGVTATCDGVLCVFVSFCLSQTAVEVFRRMILEAEKMDGGVQPGKTSCSMM